MTYAIISDIHANLEALETALAFIDTKHVDEIICLGDIVGYGASPNECVSAVRLYCSATVLGNHDAAALDPALSVGFNANARAAIQWTAEQLTDESRTFLSSRPMVERRSDLQFVHASPRAPREWNYIIDAADAVAELPSFDERCCFIGHTHVPGIFSHRGRVKTVAWDDRSLVNVGSIGQPRDGNPMLAFGLFDASSWEYHLVRLEYDIAKAASKIYDAGLPEELGFRLMYGM